MRRNRPCAMAVVSAALALLLPQAAGGQQARDADGDHGVRIEGVGEAPVDPAPDDPIPKVILETSKHEQAVRADGREAAEAAESRKRDMMREQEQRSRQRQEEERSAAGAQAAGATNAVGSAIGVAEPEEDKK